MANRMRHALLRARRRAVIGGSSPTVVVGASSGLGAALAALHFERGDEVIAVARRVNRLGQLAESAGATGGKGWANVGADISNVVDLDRLVSDLVARNGLARIYFVAARDEVRRDGTLDERLAQIDEYHRLLFTAWVGLAETLEEVGAVDEHTTLVAISSIAAGVSFRGLSLYGAGKAALEAWSRAARMLPGPRRVVVRPGRFDSDFFGPRAFDFSSLPFGRAREVMEAVDAGRMDVHLGGVRDRFASGLEARVRRVSERIVRDATPGKGDE